MASWQCCPTSSLTGGTWQQQQFGTQQLTVGWIKMLKSEADKLCTHSGQHGIFLNLQDAINVRRNIQWFTREPQESIDSYFRKSSKTAQDKKKPLLYRKGGKHNLGMEVDSDTAASFQRKIIARGLPKEWDKHEFLANNMAATGLNGFSRAPQPPCHCPKPSKGPQTAQTTSSTNLLVEKGCAAR